MVYYRCAVAFALWMGSSVVATNAKEDTKLRHGGAKGLMMRGQEERRIRQGRELVSDDRQLLKQLEGGSLHVSHGQNDNRQLGVDVTVTVEAVGNDVTVSGNWYADAVPPPTVSWREQFIVSSANLSLTISTLQLKHVLVARKLTASSPIYNPIILRL